MEKTAVTREWIIGKLVENLERSMRARPVRSEDGEDSGEVYQGSVANKALEILAKIEGHMVDRKEVGRPGDFSGMTDDELEAKIGELAAGEEVG
ncbi:hypothetical protein I6F35_35495 [Bradyrhizobium sp. BRP22]|uniref:hypothetical protein n=1 Tax=Bradyrhizobium sp. BRP22 TaxID=2793821 RepID=UPI001CD3E870|nr:hypothetical protein [Bradyrhizobium sp. BRP22]MCA1458419.1 hypothetical protein [Bradyrhizobium sp. BRP22]